MDKSRLESLAFRCRICRHLKAVKGVNGNPVIICTEVCGGFKTNFAKFELDLSVSPELVRHCVKCGCPPDVVRLNSNYVCEICKKFYNKLNKRLDIKTVRL